MEGSDARGDNADQVGQGTGNVQVPQGSLNVTVQDIISMVVATLRTSEPVKKISNNEIASLIPEFCGAVDEDAVTWFQRIEMVKATHSVEDNVIVVLLAGKLKGMALTWFHSKPEYAALRYVELKEHMIAMFSLRECRINLMRRFDARKWKRNESFSSYYHEKMLLGNQLGIEMEDMIAYMIDGFAGAEWPVALPGVSRWPGAIWLDGA